MSEAWVDRVCAECGRVFCPAPYHIFKQKKGTKTLYYCGWNCYCKRDKTPSRQYQGRARAVDVFSLNGELIHTYPTMKAASEETGESLTAITNCCKGITKATRGGLIFKYTEKEK